jgi:molecular chaperone GrpE
VALEDDVPSAQILAAEGAEAGLGESGRGSLTAVDKGTSTEDPSVHEALPGEHAGNSDLALENFHPAIATVQAAITELGSHVAKDHARAEAREKTIDRLHEEVERLRAGEIRSLLRPAVTDLRRLHGDLIGQARSAPETMTKKQVAALLESFADSVELTLERCGIVVVRPACGLPFDPRQHQTVGVTATQRPDLDGTIMKTISVGYGEVDTGRSLTPARVNIYRVQPAGDEPAAAQPNEVADGRSVPAGVPSDAGPIPPLATVEPSSSPAEPERP